MLLPIFKIFNIVLTIYTNIVIIFYVEYHREYKFSYSIFQASYYEGSTGRFWRKSYTTKYTTRFSPPFHMFLFRGFSHFFHLATVVFFWSTIGSPFSPFFPFSYPELSFVQARAILKNWRQNYNTQPKDSNQSPDMFVASYVTTSPSPPIFWRLLLTLFFL